MYIHVYMRREGGREGGRGGRGGEGSGGEGRGGEGGEGSGGEGRGGEGGTVLVNHNYGLYLLRLALLYRRD